MQSYGSMRKVSARDFAYAAIKEQIIIGILEPDTPIVEDRLAKELDISRTPLREAIHRLEVEELVVRQNNGRLKVAPISIKEVEEIFTIRGMIEGIVVQQATENATEDDVARLLALTRMIKESFQAGLRDDILHYGSQFHSYIYELSENKTAGAILSQLNDHIHRYRRLIPSRNKERLNDSYEEHQAIVEQMAAGNAQGAKEAAKQHILQSLEAVKVSIEQIEKDKGE